MKDETIKTLLMKMDEIGIDLVLDRNLSVLFRSSPVPFHQTLGTGVVPFETRLSCI